ENYWRPTSFQIGYYCALHLRLRLEKAFVAFGYYCRNPGKAEYRVHLAEALLNTLIQRVNQRIRTPIDEAVLLYLRILSRCWTGRIDLQSEERSQQSEHKRKRKQSFLSHSASFVCEIRAGLWTPVLAGPQSVPPQIIL